MLFLETAEGNFPINAINALAKICVEAEKTLDHRRLYSDLRLYCPQPLSVAETIASSAVNTVLGTPVELIVVFSETGRMTRLVAKYRPPVAILALCPTVKGESTVTKGIQTVKYLSTTRGVIAHALSKDDMQLNMIQTVFSLLF